MIKHLQLTIIFALIITIGYTQTPELVIDYIEGTEGSVDGRIYRLNDALIYEGTNLYGQVAILSYNKETDQVTELATNSDFDGDILSISSNTEEMIVFTGEGNSIKNMYLAFESDFSDIQNIYSSGEAVMRRFRFYQDHKLILEQYDIDDPKVNIKLYEPDGNIKDLFFDLPGTSSDYGFTAAADHFIIYPRTTPIDGQSLIAYSIESKSIVPFTNIVPEYIDCGIVNRFGALNDNLIYYDCAYDSYVYDIGLGQYLNNNNQSFFIIYDKPDELYFSFDGTIRKVNKTSGEGEIVFDNVVTFRSNFSSLIVTTTNGLTVDISHLNFENDQISTYPTSFPVDNNYRLTGFAFVPEGVHLTIYETNEDNGVMVRINEDSYTELDSVYNVSFLNRPVTYGEDIYYTHQDPEVGNELFLLDYQISSTQELSPYLPINISPNPVRDYLNINHRQELEAISSVIIDQTGQIVRYQINSSGEDISNLSAGMYYLKTHYKSGEVGMSKFVKQ